MQTRAAEWDPCRPCVGRGRLWPYAPASDRIPATIGNGPALWPREPCWSICVHRYRHGLHASTDDPLAPTPHHARPCTVPHAGKVQARQAAFWA